MKANQYAIKLQQYVTSLHVASFCNYMMNDHLKITLNSAAIDDIKTVQMLSL